MSARLTIKDSGHGPECRFPDDSCGCSVPLFEHRTILAARLAGVEADLELLRRLRDETRRMRSREQDLAANWVSRAKEAEAALADLRAAVEALADLLQKRGEEATARRSYGEGVEKKHAAGLVRALLAQQRDGSGSDD